MKTKHTIFILITLLFTVCLCTQLSFAGEQKNQTEAFAPLVQNNPPQENQTNSNALITQEADKQISQQQSAQETSKETISEKETSQDKIVQNQSTDKQIKKDSLFPVSTEPVPSFGWGNYFQGIGIMLLLLFVFWYILKLMRRYGNGRFLPNQKLLPRDSMYLEGQLPLGQGKSIVIVNVLGDRLVLGVTEKNINLLSKTGTNHAETFEELMEQVPLKNTPHA